MARKDRLIDSMNDKKDFDCRESKRTSHIEFFEPNSSWATKTYRIPEMFLQFIQGFPARVQELITNAEITKNNGSTLDPIIDANLHCAIRELNADREKHLHSIQEIELTKFAHIRDIDNMIEYLSTLKENIIKEHGNDD